MIIAKFPDTSGYDSFAPTYDRHWAQKWADRLVPILSDLVLSTLPVNARILDIGCGTGRVDRILTDRGFVVVGIDAGEAMLTLARKNAPAAAFERKDFAEINFISSFDAAISTYDSLNHVLSLETLSTAFRKVHAALRPGGLFLFDVNVEEGYATRWRGTISVFDSDVTWIIRPSFDPRSRLGSFVMTGFIRIEGTDHWRREDITLTQRCYDVSEIITALVDAGFEAPEVYEADRLGMSNEVGRNFFLTRRSR